MRRPTTLRNLVASGLAPILVLLPAPYAGTAPCETATLGEISGREQEQPVVIERPATGDADVQGHEIGAAQEDVPNVIGRQADEAEAELRSLKWDVLRDPAEPPPQVDDAVRIVVAQVVLDIVDENRMALCIGTTVPDLIGAGLEEADLALDQRGLVGVSAPEEAATDWVVEDQGLGPGTLARFGTQVRYTLAPPILPSPSESPTEPNTLVVVPDLVGKRVPRARRLIERSELSLELDFQGDGDRRGRIVEQDPPAGSLVLPGTVVTASVRLVGGPSEPSSSWWSSWWMVAALLAAIAAALLASAYIRSRLQRRWVLDHISVVPVADPVPVADLRASAGPTRRVHIQMHRDSGIQTVKEA